MKRFSEQMEHVRMTGSEHATFAKSMFLQTKQKELAIGTLPA